MQRHLSRSCIVRAVFGICPANGWCITIKLKLWVGHLLLGIVSTCVIVIFNECKSTISTGVLWVLCSWEMAMTVRFQNHSIKQTKHHYEQYLGANNQKSLSRIVIILKSVMRNLNGREHLRQALFSCDNPLQTNVNNVPFPTFQGGRVGGQHILS